MHTDELERWLDGVLNISHIPDASLNGIQVANRGSVTRVALAVDASEASISGAASAGADFLIVHHGLIWDKPFPWRGPALGRMRRLIESDISLYAAHLPLDLHPELGNNAQLCMKMGWDRISEFGSYHGVLIGRKTVFDTPVFLNDLAAGLGSLLGAEPTVWRFGPESVRSAAVVSGRALSMLDQAVGEGCDVYITGETGHESYWFAAEAGINVIFGGHYATETWGLAALGEKIREEWGLETVFLDLPTGY
ncbi:Nif3-like dinuclear metal center hexameric protein [bacterium]|nr:Nif3-like dinuclear metal center hexameric protein [bacterium]